VKTAGTLVRLRITVFGTQIRNTSVCTVFSLMIVGTTPVLPSADIHEVSWNLESGPPDRDLHAIF
jgi:hypothetical protein